MSHFDVFNGDADGICALHQLRLADPREATLVTGVKRDIELLERVDARPGDSVTVLDVSLDRNRQALLGLLRKGVQVEYFDHHFSGPIPTHPALRAHIDPAPGVCTSVLVDRHLRGRYRLWAVVAAFGDNLAGTALALAGSCGLTPGESTRLRELGEAINYNAYGEAEADLLIAPVALYGAVHRHASPFDFLAGDATAALLNEGRRADLALARSQPAVYRLPAGPVYVLPDAPWAHRVQGAFANELATRFPRQAHAVLCERAGQGYSASVRAPAARPQGADRLCLKFAGGGGRAAAAGIDALPAGRLQEFADAFNAAFEAQADGENGHGGVSSE